MVSRVEPCDYKLVRATNPSFENYTLTGQWLGTLASGQIAQCKGEVLWNASLADETEIRALSKMSDTNLDVGVMLGELGETIQMIRHPLKGIMAHARKYRAGRASASSWLQFQYGIKPLVSDIESVIKAFDAKWGMESNKFRSRKSSITRKTNTAEYVDSGIWTMLLRLMKSKSVEVTSTSHVYFQTNVETDRQAIQRLLGLSPTAALGVAWELTTLSFVVDWFFGIGRWLTAIQPTSHVTFLGISTSQKFTVTYEYVPVAPINYYGYVYEKFSPGKCVLTVQTLERRTGTSKPVHLPSFNPDWASLSRILSALALLVGATAGSVSQCRPPKTHRKKKNFYLF
jgi:hypothetical protein